jgi:Arc/MetJ-type ribon-helix-helix transcriptional regulator
MTVIQARVPTAIARQADEDAALLGLGNRSAAVREGLRLLHRRARERALAQDYDDFYRGATAPLSDVTAIGEQVAATAIAGRESEQ